MAQRKTGPKVKSGQTLDLSGLSPEFPQRAFDLLELFGYKPYRWQAKVIRRIYTDRHNLFALAYIQIAKKNGKTALAAMVALIELCLFDERHIYAVSDSQTNLSSVFWLELNNAIKRSGYEDYFDIYQLKITDPGTGSFIQMRPGNFAASQGINPHLVLVDEVHLMSREVWNGYLMSGDAREDSLVFGITTPGYNYDCAAYDLYNESKAGSDPELYSVIYEPENPECEPTDEAEWENANPALHESPALAKALKRHCRRMRINDFRRFRLGQWTSTEKAWLPHNAFAKLATNEAIPEGARVWLALDGSWSGDTTALIACSNRFKLQVIGHWFPPVMDESQWRVPMDKVEQAIRDACAYYNVEEVVCDPARWSRNIQALAAEGLPMVEYPQSTQRMIPATSLFYDAVMDERLEWVRDEKGKALAAHVAAAETKETDSGAMLRKPSFAPAASNIDCAVAALMAHDRATRAKEESDYSVEWVSIRRPE